MGKTPFRFLSNEEFVKLDSAARVAYLASAQREITERQVLLREQMRKTIAVLPDDTVPIPQEKREDKKP